MPAGAEPVVRIRCPTPEDQARCREALAGAGLSPVSSLTWLVVPDAHPDEVNRVLVSAGALGRVAVRQGIGTLVGWMLDRQGSFDGRARNLKSLVERVLTDGGLASRYAPRPDADLVAAARRVYERLMADGAPAIAWEEFVALFCAPVTRP